VAKKSRTASRASRTQGTLPSPSPIPEPFQLIGAAPVGAGDTTKEPMLVLRGHWLKACGFPIGSAAYVTADARGEITLDRLGLGVGRRIKIVAAKR